MRSLKLTAASLLLIAIAGCGGGEEEAAALKKSSSAAPVPVQAAQAPRAEKADSGSKKKAAARTRPEPAAPAALTAEQAENGFTVLAEPPPNYQVLSSGEDEQADQFAVVLPAEGISSSSFKVTPPPQSGGSGGQRAASQKLPEGFEAVAGSGASESGWPLQIRCEKDDSILIFIPGGAGPLGSDSGPADARPQLTIPLQPFYIQQHEVTLKQYRTYRDEIYETKKRYRPQPLNVDSPDDHPALGLAWGEGGFYARWIGGELPTEAEWERAARTEAGWRTPWGEGRAVWARSRERNQIDPVMSFRTDVSPQGVYDLAGNAREWVDDWYSDTAFADAAKRPLDLPNWAGPRKPSIDNHRVVKGNGPDWSAWHRGSQHMSQEAADIGFRCVLRLKAESEDEEEQKKKGSRRN